MPMNKEKADLEARGVGVIYILVALWLLGLLTAWGLAAIAGDPLPPDAGHEAQVSRPGDAARSARAAVRRRPPSLRAHSAAGRHAPAAGLR
jgi:hypothetical protein